jgi:hypothetical protein
MVVQVLQLTYGWGLGLNKPCCFPARHLSQVWGVFSVTSLCYAILVPCFLSYLFAKQHFVLRSNKLLMSCSKPNILEEKDMGWDSCLSQGCGVHGGGIDITED